MAEVITNGICVSLVMTHKSHDSHRTVLQMASDQKLDGGNVWEWGYLNNPTLLEGSLACFKSKSNAGFSHRNGWRLSSIQDQLRITPVVLIRKGQPCPTSFVEDYMLTHVTARYVTVICWMLPIVAFIPVCAIYKFKHLLAKQHPTSKHSHYAVPLV